MTRPLLELADIEKSFHGRSRGRRRVVRALSGVSLSISPGESLGLVGESGSGKTTLARIAIGLQAPSSGRRLLDGVPYQGVSKEQRRTLARQVQMVFQDPRRSLNPRKTAEQSLTAPLAALTDLDADEQRQRARELSRLVELDESLLPRYPHELSGGQAQRLAIARALAPDPRLLILDEAVASLDVSVQAHVLRLLHRLKRRLGVSYLFITHDLATVEILCERVAVMYLGRVVEQGPTRTVLDTPKHPYTRALISAVPRLGRPSQRIELSGEPPSPANLPAGCAFHPRCYRSERRCQTRVPELGDGQVDHPCACFFAHDSAPGEAARKESE